jgi:prepilin-type N-terminal cleavage/methylation domain-containing protein
LLRHNPHLKVRGEQGFSLVELLVVITLIGVLSGLFFSTFNTTTSQYFGLQVQGSNFANLASQSNRIANVVRGATDIISAAQDDLQIYAYFAPADTYVSQVHYYKNAAGNALLADVTRMTANPPTGTPIVSSKQTYTVLSNYKQVSGVKLFAYLDAVGNELVPPISDLHTIKGIRVELAVPGTNASSNQAIEVQVSLRNRKTNL